MEATVITYSIILTTFLILILIHKFMYQKMPEVKEIKDYQKILDNHTIVTQRLYKELKYYDSLTEILKQRNTDKAFCLMIAAFLFGMIFLFPNLRSELSPLDKNLIQIAMLYLFTNGITKLIEDKKIAVLVALILISLGLIFIYQAGSIIMLSVFSILFMIGLMTLLSLFIFAK